MDQEKKRFEKELSDIAWNVDEPTYRADPALSYSTLATYERNGKFNAIPTLFERKTSASLTFGSLVDCMMTDAPEEFDKRFMVAEFPVIGEQLQNVAKTLADRFGQPVDENSDDYTFGKRYYPTFDMIPDETLAEVGKECNYYQADKFEKLRVKKIKESCEDYYNLVLLSEGKQVISQSDYDEAVAACDALRNSAATRYMFKPDVEESNVRRYYQLKFKFTHNNVHYRSMADLIIVDYKSKTVIPIDLKTSSHAEWDFPKSFLEWNYEIQGRLYWRNIRDNMDRDPYFKDFKLTNYKFVVVNRNNNIPLVWNFEDTQKMGPLEYRSIRDFTVRQRDPYEIGEELNAYLVEEHKVPIGISMTEPNNIREYLENN